jgi:hypothetical protein
MPQSVNKTQSKWCINKHGASENIDTFETYQCVVAVWPMVDGRITRLKTGGRRRLGGPQPTTLQGVWHPVGDDQLGI